MGKQEKNYGNREQNQPGGNLDIGFMVTNISYGIRGCFDRLFSGYDVTYPQSRVLTRLFGQLGKADVNQRDLEHALGIKASSVSSLVKNLEEKGLIRSERSETDSRNKLIILTDAGLELREMLGNARVEVEEQLVKGMTEQETIQFHRYLTTVMENLEDLDRTPKGGHSAEE